MQLSIENLTVHYGKIVALNNASFTAESGCIVALLGPSGCGKSTLLRAIAGLVVPSSGRIRIGGRDIVQVPIHARRVGMVFQDYALFTHMDVTENVEFGLRMTGTPRREWSTLVTDVLRKFHLEQFNRKRVTELSGGQQQRVALARTLVTKPDVLLLDEPLSALDRQLREKARLEIRRVVKASGITTVIVTHDQEEALGLADQIIILHNGKVEQCGSGRELYRKPANSFVASFMGKVNFIHARIVAAAQEPLIKLEDYPYPIALPDTIRQLIGTDHLQECTLAIRPESLEIAHGPGEPGVNRLAGVVRDTTFLGQQWELVVEVDGLREPLLVSVTSESGRPEHAAGQRIELLPDWERVSVNTADGKRMIGSA